MHGLPYPGRAGRVRLPKRSIQMSQFMKISSKTWLVFGAAGIVAVAALSFSLSSSLPTGTEKSVDAQAATKASRPSESEPVEKSAGEPVLSVTNQATTSDASQNDIASLQNSVKKLQDNILGLAAELEALKNGHSEPPASPSDPVAQQQQAVAEFTAKELAMEQGFQNEGTDMDWSQKEESRLKEAMQSISYVSLGELRCASSMCKLTATVDAKQTTPDHFVRELSKNVRWEGGARYRIDRESNEVVAYFNRDQGDASAGQQ